MVSGNPRDVWCGACQAEPGMTRATQTHGKRPWLQLCPSSLLVAGSSVRLNDINDCLLRHRPHTWMPPARLIRCCVARRLADLVICSTPRPRCFWHPRSRPRATGWSSLRLTCRVDSVARLRGRRFVGCNSRKRVLGEGPVQSTAGTTINKAGGSRPRDANPARVSPKDDPATHWR